MFGISKKEESCKMKVIKTALWLLFVTCISYSVVSAASNVLSTTQLKNLKPLKSYTASAYTLKTGVAYFEIREYVWDSTHKVNKNNYKVIV